MFSFGFIEGFYSKGILNTLINKGVTSAMECADAAAFTFAR